ncbi:MAG: hypothetical protein DRN04_03210 [Thermoprotei archaeon]|nr:MAG: hypothetical protein DRN04_03210 [Thermoprotei archaeon]
MNIKVIDVHCHLTHCAFKEDLDRVIYRAQLAGIECLITSTLRLSEIKCALEIKSTYSNKVYLSIGCSPTLFDFKEIENIRKFIEKNVNEIVGIGEVGLDYSVVKDNILRSVQVENFSSWITLAQKLNLPIIVHVRKAEKIILQLIKEYNNVEVPVILHAYSGPLTLAREFMKLKNVYFSIPPSVCKSTLKQKLVEILPLEKILLESDAPYLHPFSFERNEPSFIMHSLVKIAKIKNVSIEEVASISYKTSKKIFGLE